MEECQVTLKAPSDADPLKDIDKIIAISSCKGGVGKSTLSIHLAQELAARGKKVGVVDCDIYGPSLPTLLNINHQDILANEKGQLIPIQHNNMKVMSFGFLLGDNPAIMRGPIVTRYIHQILLNTDWGHLDYLMIDMPPGTGDVHLTITQTIRLDGAVIITTPHTLSLIDVARGILMFERVRVPILGIIENMSYFQTEDSNKKHFLFGEPSTTKLSKRFGVPTLAEIPILKNLSHLQTKVQTNSYVQEAVDALNQSIDKAKTRFDNIPSISFDDKKISLSFKEGKRLEVTNFDLRLNSQDALSVDELTGEKKLKPEDIRADIAAKEIRPLGNYALGIQWNDGHSSGIYSYELIEEIANQRI